MPVILDAINLEEMIEDDEMLLGWVKHSVQNGRTFSGYSGNVYTHTEYGDAEIYSCLVINKEEKKCELEDYDIHVSGSSMWDVRLSGIALKNKAAHNMTRLCAVKSKETGSFTIMHVLNADVLPSFLENDEIRVQVCAFALDVNYYENEEAFADTIPECEGMKFEELNGKKLYPAMGTVFPNGFFGGHMVKEDGTSEQDDSNDDIVVITGIVKAAYVESVKFGDDVMSKYIKTRIETQFGDLEIVHSRSMITDEEAATIKEGAVVQAVAVLSGDAAIYDYANGVVKDHKNDLAALRYAMMKGNAERLSNIMADDITYESFNSKSVIEGKENVIEHIDYVHENTKTKYFSYLATLENENPGERCFILAENEPDNLTAIVRILVDDDGMITKILVGNDSNVKFKIDEQPKEPWEEEEE